MTPEPTDASAGAETDQPAAVTDYEGMLDTLDVAIEEAQRKIESGRVYDAENERVRIKWIKALAYTLDIRRKIANDRDLEELAEEIEQIKANQQASTNGAGMVTGGSR